MVVMVQFHALSQTRVRTVVSWESVYSLRRLSAVVGKLRVITLEIDQVTYVACTT